MLHSSPRMLLTALAVACLFAAGCSDIEKQVVEVSGTLKFSDGTPLPAGTKLMFNPTEGRTGTASATTEGDGSFTLTHVSGTSGAEVGKYTIQLTPPAGQEKEFYKLVPKDAAEGTLFADIAEGMQPLALTVPKRRK